MLVSGGKVDPGSSGPPGAEVMHAFLSQQGVDAADLITESRSRTTYENAVESCRLLRERGVRKILLVTDAVHMHRAARCFRKQGVEVVPAPCNHRATEFDLSLFAFLPDPRAAAGLQEAAHEWLGLAWYWLQGRI